MTPLLPPIPSDSGEKLGLLAQSPLFRSCPQPLLSMVARHCDVDIVPAGTTLIEQGNGADQLHVLAQGEVQVSIDGRSRGELRPGDLIGFAAAVTGGSPGTAVASTDVILISLDLAELWQLTLASGLGRAMVMSLGAFVVGLAPGSFPT